MVMASAEAGHLREEATYDVVSSSCKICYIFHRLLGDE